MDALRPQKGQTAHVVDHYHHAHGEGGTGLADGADTLTTPLGDGGKDVFYPRPNLGDALIPPLLAGREWLAKIRLALNLRTIAVLP